METPGVEAQRQKPFKGGATERSAASSEACRVVKIPIVRWDKGEPSPECRAKAMEAAKILELQP